MKTPERTTAAAFPRYAAGGPLADSASLQWKGLFVRRYRLPRVVDRFLVPATPEPLISCGLAGSAEFREREIGGAWLTRQIGPGHTFLSPAQERLTSVLSVRLLGRSWKLSKFTLRWISFLRHWKPPIRARRRRWK